jgi:fused signal recognition particle receptor
MGDAGGRRHFRAAAIEQLKIWGERIKAPVIAGKEGGDAAGIVYDGVKQAPRPASTR